MMNDLNCDQKRMAETLDGLMVVDAGPGTGKTKTVVSRYLNLISQDDVKPSDVLLLTFTRNAAQEMEERIKNAVSVLERDPESRLYNSRASHSVHVQTFDSFCLSVIMESPDTAGKLFGIPEKMSHSVKLDTNESLIRRRFYGFLDSFLEDVGDRYGFWPAIAVQNRADLYKLIDCLMTRGIYPLEKGWFGGDDGRQLVGKSDELYNGMIGLNLKGKRSKMADVLKKVFDKHNDYATIPGYEMNPIVPECVPEKLLERSAKEDRSALIGFIHDVYREYVRFCMKEDRLTFGVASMMAFSIMYIDSSVREHNSYKHIIIDEFQDTNAAQIMMALMILEKPNLCVVGDWKQGIYGFRNVSIEFILEFRANLVELSKLLNKDGMKRVAFGIPESVSIIPFTVNYRSSQTVVDSAFRCMDLKCTKNEIVGHCHSITKLTAAKEPLYSERTDVRYIKTDAKEDEPDAVYRCIIDYVYSGDYEVYDKDEDRFRQPRFSDIAVLCRSNDSCRLVMAELEGDGIPAFLQTDVEIMSTREGKLVLAWLRYVSNDSDPRGLGAIMADLGYSLAECKEVCENPRYAPDDIIRLRNELRRKRMRINELVTSIFAWYGICNDISQAIVNVLSDLHEGTLLTLSDIISIMEDDINEGKSTYPVENPFDSDTVSVMTMHKSKGLEFPIVIIPYVDYNKTPLKIKGLPVFFFDPLTGIRCSRTVCDFNGYSKCVKSWKTELVNEVTSEKRKKDVYDEERRLMFVAMSRAKQYTTLICGPSPSTFMTGLCSEPRSIHELEIPDVTIEVESKAAVDKPDLSGYRPNRRTLSPHDLMHLSFDSGSDMKKEEDGYGGKEYGTKVHEEAERMHNMCSCTHEYPESQWIIDNVLSRIKEPWGGKGPSSCIQSYSELNCMLPLNDPDVVIRGVIDLLIVFEDRIEIHDYKTDVSKRLQGEYEVQLSVYAEIAKRVYPTLPVRCFIDYAHLQEIVEFEPLPFETIRQRVIEALENGEESLE